jgi:hypothetical protein
MEPIVVVVAGGLGNQLFQFSAGSALARASGRQLALCCRGFDESPIRRFLRAGRRILQSLGRTPDERFTLQSAGRAAEVLSVQTIAAEPSRKLERALSLRGGALRRLVRGEAHRTAIVVREGQLFDRLAEGREALPDKPLILIGFHQSDRVVEPQIDWLRQVVHLPRHQSRCAATIGKLRVGVRTVVGVHVRRGDYTSRRNSGSFALLEPEWYLKASQLLRDRHGLLAFLIVSDDPAWCARHLRCPGPTVVASSDHPSSPLEDLALLVDCDHHIVANSTFSWWGARLAPAGGDVVAPSRWYLGRETPADLLPSAWIRLENGA